MQESKEALERLRRMGAFEAQDFDTTVRMTNIVNLATVKRYSASSLRSPSLALSSGAPSVASIALQSLSPNV